MKCRHCGAAVTSVFADLGSSPPSNAYLSQEGLESAETWYPLRVLVCEGCWLVQTEDFAAASELFDAEYAYFSGFSSSWIEHCSTYAANMVNRFGLNASNTVVEVASNDGTLLQCFSERGISCLGIEPTTKTADAARDLGLDVVEEFLTVELANRLVAGGLQADLLAANNVVAHVPDIDDFVKACGRLLTISGVATFEFPHLLRLVAENQFDTVYHEHFSYLSLTSFEAIVVGAGLEIFDVEEIPTHGGSLRVFVHAAGCGRRVVGSSVERLRRVEEAAGIAESIFYAGFQNRINLIKDELVQFLLDAKTQSRLVLGYGAAAKGNTLLNYAGVRPDLLPMVVDRNPAKQGMYLPGSRIPIVAEEAIERLRPDCILILPWNLRSEVSEQLGYVRDWGATFVTAVPGLQEW
ncbi:MAG: class I SAM-dependent methyltransferase [Acidimicrobiales bacterium]|nr:class I SAM-dependent methyltransferase [Acidimicrobiales bacterium]